MVVARKPDLHWRRPPRVAAPRTVLSIREIEREAYLVPRQRRRLPATRGECPTYRPCPYVTCRYHLAYHVTATGSIQATHPDVPLEAMPVTCALDAAEVGPLSLDEIGEIMNLSYEAVRRIERAALAKIRDLLEWY